MGKYKYKGDANLDGKVTGDDYAFVDSNLGLTGPTVQWSQGDFNLDDKVTGDDYAFIDANLGKGTVTPLSGVEPVGAVPVVTSTTPPVVSVVTISSGTVDSDASLLRKKKGSVLKAHFKLSPHR